MNHQLLDPIPVLGVLVLFAIISLAIYEVGFRVGRWWQERTPDENEGPTGMIVGSLLALMAFLLAVAMGMASDRFDTRRGLVLEEANSIGTTYLRAQFLPPPTTRRSATSSASTRSCGSMSQRKSDSSPSSGCRRRSTRGSGRSPTSWRSPRATG